MSSSFAALVVGTGSIGERHVRCFFKTGRAEVSICERDDAVRERVAAAYPVRGAFASLDEALAAQRYDLAVVATPAPLHVPMALQLVAAGCHLLIEKPLSTSFDGVEQLEAAVAERGVTAAVAYVYRAHPAMRAMRERLHSGQLGPPVQIVVSSGQHFPTHRPAYRDIYYADHRQGGGAIQDGITHMLNLVQWWVGPADRLLVDAAHQVLDGVTVEDTVHILTRHGNVPASFTFNQYQAANETRYTVVCAPRGAGAATTLRCELSPARLRIVHEADGEWEDHPVPVHERDDMYVFQANAFLDAVEGRAQVLCTIGEAAQTLGVALAALRGIEQQSWLHPLRPGEETQ